MTNATDMPLAEPGDILFTHADDWWNNACGISQYLNYEAEMVADFGDQTA